MSLRSKLTRVRSTIDTIATRGVVRGAKTALNRYTYEHKTYPNLPVISSTTPYHIQVEPSRVCNLRCKMCEYSFMSNKGAILKLEPFKKVLAQFPAVESIDLSGIGEPFCNPDFMDMARHAKERGLYVQFNNNGNLLTEEKMDALIEMGVDNVNFSVDAARQSTHESIRAYSKFDKVCSTIKTFTEKIAAAPECKLACRMTYTVSKENFAEMPEFVALAGSLGVRSISFRDMIFFEGSGYDSSQGIETLSEEVRAEARSRILAESERHGVEVDLDIYMSPEAPKGPRMCRRPWMTAFIDVYGNFYPCCLVTQRNDDTTQYAMGNILEQDFEEIWNNAAYQSLRAGMTHPSDTPPLCAGCRMLKK